MVFLKILIAALASVILGYLWYHPRLFGARWMRLVSMSPEMAERTRARAKRHMLAALTSSAFIALASQIVLSAAGVETFSGALIAAGVLWLGFVAPTEFLETLWEERPLPLFLINTGYWLIALVLVSLILSL